MQVAIIEKKLNFKERRWELRYFKNKRLGALILSGVYLVDSEKSRDDVDRQINSWLVRNPEAKMVY